MPDLRTERRTQKQVYDSSTEADLLLKREQDPLFGNIIKDRIRSNAADMERHEQTILGRKVKKGSIH